MTAVAENLTPAVASPENLARTIEQVKLNLNEIHCDLEENVREGDAYEGEEFNDLMASIKAHGGIYTPLQVVPLDVSDFDEETISQEGLEGKKYLLNAGFRRYLCLETLSEDDASFAENVPCVVIDVQGDEVSYKALQIMENLQRAELKPLEIAEAYSELLNSEESDLSLKQLANRLGKTVQHVKSYMKLRELPGNVQDLLRDGKLTATHCMILQQVEPGEDKQVWIELAKSALGKSTTMFRSIVEKKYHTNTDSDSTVVETTEGKQKLQFKVRRGKDLYGKYIPKLQELRNEAKAANKESEAARWQIILDTVHWVLCNDKSKLTQDLEAWENELIAEQESARKKKGREDNKKKFLSGLCGQVRDLFNAEPEDPEEPRPTLSQCFSAVKKDLSVQVDKAKQDGKDVDEVFGFEFAGVDSFMEEFLKFYYQEEERRAHQKKVKAYKRDFGKLYHEATYGTDEEKKAEAAEALASKASKAEKYGLNDQHLEEIKKQIDEKESAKKSTK